MFYRIAELFNDTGMGAAGTEIIDINVEQPITQMIIQQRSTGAQDTPTAHLAAVLPKIEIIDGSDVLYSLASYEADAFDFYHRKQAAFGANVYLNGVQGIKTYILNFGRFVWDPLLALDPMKFKNPQLKITYDRDAGGCLSSALEIQVVVKLFDEKAVSPSGFLMHKEIKKYTPVAGTWEYTNMPTDYPWRMLLISSRYTGRHPHAQFREIKLSEDVDKKIPFHFDTNNLIKWIQTNYPKYREDLFCSNGGAARTYYVTPAYNVWFAGHGENAVTIQEGASGGAGGTISLEGSAASNIYGHVDGYCPHGSVVFPFGLQNEIEDWYDVSKVGSLKLHTKAHAGWTSGDIQICLQQLRRY